MTHDPDALARALKHLDGLEATMIDFCRRMVEINSYSENVAGNDAVAALLAEALDWPSLTPTTIPGQKRAAHRVWRTRASGPPILLIGHHDTVFPPGHFEGWVSDGARAVGPGALDMKGGLAVIWGALAALEKEGLLGQLPLAVMSVADEEVGSTESRPHLTRLAQGAACALVFESGRRADAIVTSRRGTGTLELSFLGRAAHAGNAHADGRNAVWAMARFIDTAQGLTDYSRGTTVNVGLASGGTAANTVPEAATCKVDVRFEHSAEATALLAALREAAERAAASVGARVVISGGANRLPMDRTEASLALYREYAEHARASGLGFAENPTVGGGSDANTVAALGVPVIDGLGPRGDGFHTPSEWVDLTSFKPKAAALLRFLCGRLGRSG